jgi:hypothetical protein
MALPGVKVVVFLERLVVRNATFHTLSKISNGRNNRCCNSSRGRGRSRSDSGMPNPACIFGKVKPVDSGRRNGLSEPQNEGTQFLDLDDIESSILVRPVLDDAKLYTTVCLWVNGYEIQGTSYSGFSEASPKGRDNSIRQGDGWLS